MEKYFTYGGDFSKTEGVISGLSKEGEQEPNIIIPDGCVRVADSAFFRNTIIEKICLPDTIETMGGKNIFYGCSNIKYAKLSKNLKFIPFRCFDDCASLSKVDMFEGLEAIGDPNIKLNQDSFKGCGFINLVLPSTVLYIGGASFLGNNNLKTFVTNATTFGNTPFWNCKQQINFTLTTHSINKDGSDPNGFAYSWIDGSTFLIGNFYFKVRNDDVKNALKDKFRIPENKISVGL